MCERFQRSDAISFMPSIDERKPIVTWLRLYNHLYDACNVIFHNNNNFSNTLEKRNCSFLSSLFHCLFWHCKKKKKKKKYSNSKANSEFYSELQNKSVIIEYCSPVINFTTIVFLYIVVNTIPRVFSFIRSYACNYFFFLFFFGFVLSQNSNSIDKSRTLGSIFRLKYRFGCPRENIVS